MAYHKQQLEQYLQEEKRQQQIKKELERKNQLGIQRTFAFIRTLGLCSEYRLLSFSTPCSVRLKSKLNELL